MGYFYLLLAILFEVASTISLTHSDGFTKPLPSIIATVGFCASLYFFALVLTSIPVGVAYAIWSGVGILIIAVISITFMGEKPDFAAIVGMSLILIGVIIIKGFSKSGL